MGNADPIKSISCRLQPHPNRNRAIQEGVQKLDSKVGVSLRTFSREVEELREWMAQSIESQSAQAGREKNVNEGRFSEVKAQLKGLRRYVVGVEEVIQTKFPPRRGGTAAFTDSPIQGQDSPRVVEGSISVRRTRETSSAAASSSVVQPTDSNSSGRQQFSQCTALNCSGKRHSL